MAAKFRPFDDLDPPEKRRRNLPHWEIEGATYFVTFRLADAIPAGVLREIELRAEAWLRSRGLTARNELGDLPAAANEEFRRTISAEEERWLDSGQGCCDLGTAACRAPLVETLHHFDGVRYALDAYVIMPNHVHAVVQPNAEWRLGKIIATWKQFAARRINEAGQQRGALWQHDSFDHIVRAWDKLEACRRYIAANPVKAKLRADEYHAGVGSGIVQ